VQSSWCGIGRPPHDPGARRSLGLNQRLHSASWCSVGAGSTLS
jgi:hypothetical protein